MGNGGEITGVRGVNSLMRNQTIGIYSNPLPIVFRLIRVGVQFSKTRLLETAVVALLVFWWLQVFGLGVNYLQWAASLGIGS